MPDSPLEPLALPRDLDGWRAFADERPRRLLDHVSAIDARLVAETALTLRERLALWNDADIALSEAAAPSHLLSESHPDAGVRDALAARGHEVRTSGAWTLGRMCAVARDPGTGVLSAAANPRGMQGYAVGR